MILVYRYRVKSLNGLLNAQARAVNFVWNYCNDAQRHALAWGQKWPTGFDLVNKTAGCGKDLGLHSSTINAIALQYATSRRQRRRPYLRYRGKKSLGWIPLKGPALRREGNAFRFYGQTFRVFNSRPLPDGKIRDGSNFSRDASGNWFLNIAIDVAVPAQRPLVAGLGIDLGLIDFAVLSTGERIPNPRHLASLAARLAVAQRARKKSRAAKIHASIGNARRDFRHKLSTRLVKDFDYIAVGNVNASGLAKTRMAKSVLDASWTSFRNMLRYKAIAHGAWYEEVDERFTSATCSACGSRSGPTGLKGLQIRQWCCQACGSVHDRDQNASVNILARHGHAPPVEGISAH